MTAATETVAPGIYGAKRQSWRENNPRDSLIKLIKDNPRATEKEISDLHWREVCDNMTMLQTIHDYWFANNWRSVTSSKAHGNGDHSSHDTHSTVVPVPVRDPSVSVAPDRLRALAGTADLVKDTLLRRYAIDGKPFDECFPPAIRLWAVSRRDNARTATVEARWAEMLVAGLDDRRTVGSQRTQRQAQRLFAKARREIDA